LSIQRAAGAAVMLLLLGVMPAAAVEQPACRPDGAIVLLSYRALAPVESGSADPPPFRPLDRQAVLAGLTEIDAEIREGCAELYSMRWFSVVIGAKPLCLVGDSSGSCEIDFGNDFNSWALTIKTSLIDEQNDRVFQRRIDVTTLNAGLHDSDTRFARSHAGIAIEDRAAARRIPHDEVRRVALVLDEEGLPRAGLSMEDFKLSLSGVEGAQIVHSVPMHLVEDTRLFFLLVDVADYIHETGAAPQWRSEYGSFVRALARALEAVSDQNRKLLVVRYAVSSEASPVVALDEEGIESIASWLLSPPPEDWNRQHADLSTALLKAYDMFLHDFEGQPLGLIVAGGRNTLTEPSSMLSDERLRDLNPLWKPEKVRNLLAELDSGLTDLFPHTEQRGFPLHWAYVPSTKELTGERFVEASEYFYRFGGDVFRLASIRDQSDGRGQRASGGSLHLAELFRRLFDRLESSYLLLLRIPNPKQRRRERTIELSVEDCTVKTQTFYRPSEPLKDNIERYLGSASKERRFRAAYAARNYALDKSIYKKVESWLSQEPSSQVLPILEESKLIMDFKRLQARDRDVRVRASEELLTLSSSDVEAENTKLLLALQELAERRMIEAPEQFGGTGRVRRILALRP
jgi:hypothetical protein